jgi:Protein of unknown function (Hypoth_ymh)
VTLDVQRCRSELDALEAQLDQWTAPSPPGFDVWRHKMHSLIGEILEPNHSLAIRLTGLTDPFCCVTARPATIFGTSYNPRQEFARAKQAAVDIIEALRWELDRMAPATAPFSDATVDPELWNHVRGLVDAGDWEKVAREAAVFVEDKLRIWASVPPSVTGSVNVFKAAIGGSNGFTLPKAGASSEQQGWQQLATGFALALRNPSGHQVTQRSDAERYALGILGVASILLTEIRHEYGDPPKP